MDIRYIGRADADRKPGGDTIQMHRYATAAKEAGHRVLFGIDRPQVSADVIHLLNIDRPIELTAQLKAVASR